MNTLVNFITAIGVNTSDSDELRIQKNFMIYFGIAMSGGGLVWGVICYVLGLHAESSIPLGYGGLTLLNFFYFYRWRNFVIARFFQILISLLLPFMFQYAMGGFIASGGAMLWALISLLISLTFSSVMYGICWLVAYVLFTIAMGVAEPYFPQPFVATRELSTLFFVINISTISTIVFALSFYFIRSRTSALQKAEAANRAKTEFMANISHELRTPLNGIIGFTDLLTRTELKEQQRQYLNIVGQSANSLLDIINDILDFAKLQSGKVKLFPERVNLREFCQKTIDQVLAQANAKQLKLLVHVDDKCPVFVVMDPVRVRQVLLNLLGNGVKFTQQGSVSLHVDFALALSQHASVIRFKVSDTGIGIEEKNQTKIFEAFVQEDISTTKKFGGTGLGLTIANSMLSLMGSHIFLQSEVGKGSSFQFDLSLESEF
jgi:signal transduction histidine kinase